MHIIVTGPDLQYFKFLRRACSLSGLPCFEFVLLVFLRPTSIHISIKYIYFTVMLF